MKLATFVLGSIPWLIQFYARKYNFKENLTIHAYSITTQVLIDENKKAYGIVYERHGIPKIAHAAKEVIISGIFSSSLLLMKSGVGPRSLNQGSQAYIVSSSAKQDGQEGWQDIQIIYVPTCPIPEGTYKFDFSWKHFWGVQDRN